MQTPPDDAPQILEALAHAATGNRAAAEATLAPLIHRSPQSAYATLCALAEMAVAGHREPGTFHGLTVLTDTGAPAQAADLPPAIRFAAQFTTAHANRDFGTSHALFRGLCLVDDGAHLDGGISAVLDMATEAAREVIAKRRAEPTAP